MSRCTVHTNSSRKLSFSKTLFKPEEFENARSSFSCGRKHVENGAFQKQWRHENHVISLTEVSLNINSFEVIGDCWVFKFLGHSVDGKHLMRFQRDTSAFKFFRLCVDGASSVRNDTWKV